MRNLTELEMKTMFEKIKIYVGPNIRQMVESSEGTYVFRYHRDRVFYLSDSLAKATLAFPRKQIMSTGTLLGKFTKTGKFRLQITSLDVLAKHSPNKVWLKTSGEQSFLYGNHVIRRHMGKLTENLGENEGVVIFSHLDMPLGFGLLSKSSDQLREAQPETIAVIRQSEVGEYLRIENKL